MRKNLFRLLQILIVGVSIGFFIYQWRNIEANTFQNGYESLRKNWGWTILVIFLMLDNWFLEGLKFHFLLNKTTPLKIQKAIASIFCGITVSNFTPARTGEYLGRMVYLKNKDSVSVVSATMFGNAFQAMNTYFWGILALAFSGNYHLLEGSINKVIWGVLGAILAVIIFLKSPKILSLIQTKWSNFIRDKIAFLSKLTYSEIGYLLILSSGRYLIFSAQFFILLFIFSGGWLPFSKWILIPIVYLMQSIVPVPAVADIGVRIYVSQMVFGNLFTAQEILFTVTSIWFINLIAPAFIGLSIFIINGIKKWFG